MVKATLSHKETALELWSWAINDVGHLVVEAGTNFYFVNYLLQRNCL
jgi:hypothetical protein